MQKFNYYRPGCGAEVSKLLLAYPETAGIIAGGTDLMVQLREGEKRFQRLAHLIDLSALKEEMGSIREEEENIVIGALATHTEIEYSELVRNHLPFLSQAAASVGSPQIRNLGTIGGSICNGSPAADPLPALIAAGTTVLVQGEEGLRPVSLVEFYRGRGQLDLRPGEFVKEFRVNKLPAGASSVFVKLGRRKALAISRLNAAVSMKINEAGEMNDVRIAPGCIFTRPDRVKEAEVLLNGQKPSMELFDEAGKTAADVMVERTGIRWSTEYKRPALEGMIADGLSQAAGWEVE